MYDLDVQIRDYVDATSAPLTVDEVLHVPVGDEPVRPFAPRGGGRRPLTGWLVAGAAAAIVVLVIGAVGLFAALRSGGEAVVEPTTSTTLIGGVDALVIAESFAQARSDGDADAVVALLAGDASVDMGPAATPSDVPAEMGWQQAIGLTFTFGRCEPAAAITDGDAASSSCFVTWTGAVATSLGHGEDTFEYAIDVADDRVVSVALVDLGDYQETTWRPFLDWMSERHSDEVATIYTPDGHAVLTDESIELWRLRTAEFVAEQTVLATTTTFPPGTPLAVEPIVIDFGDTHSVTWMQLVPASVGEPFRVFELPDGSYAAASGDGHPTGVGLLRSPDGRTWVEQPIEEELFPGHVVERLEGEWAATYPVGDWQDSQNMTLWRHVDDQWQPIGAPDDIDRFDEPTVSGDTTLVAGIGAHRHVMIRSEGTEAASVHEMPWVVFEPGEHENLDETAVVTLQDGSFMAFVNRYDRLHQDGADPDHQDYGWGPAMNIWTSADGVIWAWQGVADFVDEGADAVYVIDRGDAIVVTEENWPDSGPIRRRTWTSTDGVTWTPGTDKDYFGAATETSQGYLITGTEWMLSTDGGDSWITVPDHPEDPDSNFAGFSFGGIAGDLMYRSAGEGLWVGYID